MKKIRILNNYHINKAKWDACIENAINCNIYASSWYLNIVTHRWSGLIYGDYELVFPITYKQFLFFKKIYHPFFCQQLGPFSGDQKLLYNQDVVLQILSILNTKYRRFTFSINYNCAQLFKQTILSQKISICYLDRINLELSLNNSYQNISSNYSTNHKRNLKEVYSDFKWDIESIFNSAYINDFLISYKEFIGSKAGLKKCHYSTMKYIINDAFKKNIGYFIGLRGVNNKLLGAAFFISSYSNRDILLFNFSSKMENINIMTVIIDKYIKINSNKHKILDFEGSNIPSLKRFYTGFGAVEKNYIHILK